VKEIYFVNLHLPVSLHKIKCSFNATTWNTLDTITYTHGTQGPQHVGDLPHAGISLYLITSQFMDCML